MTTTKPLNFISLTPQRDGSKSGVLNPLYSARAKVPGGWLVTIGGSSAVDRGITFYPDPEHKWDGGSLN